jgi:DNA-binding transcriptional ArsR family regulator
MHEYEEEKITLDRETFKTLASGTRIGILKSLGVRRKTLSELAKEHGMSVSTVKEHLDNLVGAGLIIQKDDGHKWKYYELTKKGRAVLNPEDKKIWILLSLSAIAMLATGIDMSTGLISRALLSHPAIGASVQDIMRGAEPLAGEGKAETTLGTGGAAGAGAGTEPAAWAVPWLHMALLLVFAALAVFFIYRIARKRGALPQQ